MRCSRLARVSAYFCSTVFMCVCAPILQADSSAKLAAESEISHPKSHDLLLFSDFSTYNPLKNNQAVTIHRGGENIQAFSNEQLVMLADNSRNNTMIASHRALNQQWLGQHQNQESIKFGSRALRKILQLGFKTYWDALRRKAFKGNQMIPDSEGNGQFNNATVYKVGLSDDTIKLAVKYSF